MGLDLWYHRVFVQIIILKAVFDRSVSYVCQYKRHLCLHIEGYTEDKIECKVLRWFILNLRQRVCKNM